MDESSPEGNDLRTPVVPAPTNGFRFTYELRKNQTTPRKPPLSAIFSPCLQEAPPPPPPSPPPGTGTDLPETPAAPESVDEQTPRRYPSHTRISAAETSSNCLKDTPKRKGASLARGSANKRGKEESSELGNARDDKEIPPHNSIANWDSMSEDVDPARRAVLDKLSLFETIYKKLLTRKLQVAAKPDMLAFKEFNEQSTVLGGGRGCVGNVPGVKVGDEFNLRVELCVVGVHRLHRLCVDLINQEGKMVAVSVVHMRSYLHGMSCYDDFVFSSSGDLKIEGNLALKNSMDTRTPVRVIHGFRGHQSTNSRATKPKSKTSMSVYVYGGLYVVEKYWRKRGDDGLYACMFQFKRILRQPELSAKEVKASRPSEDLIVEEVSSRKEILSDSLVNFEKEHPEPFKNTTQIIYPSQHSTCPSLCCVCVGGCPDSDKCKCACAVNNAREIGAIVETKPIFYMCGPSCKCSPSFHNGVSQNDVGFHLELFKTKSKGWGVRSQNPIPSGSFICEYVRERSGHQVADKLTKDGKLFANNCCDENLCKGLNVNIADLQNCISFEVEEGSFVVDASEHDKVGRFISRSCTPNLYAQNILYHNDKKCQPRIAFVAAKDIPALQELTYDDNDTIIQRSKEDVTESNLGTLPAEVDVPESQINSLTKRKMEEGAQYVDEAIETYEKDSSLQIPVMEGNKHPDDIVAARQRVMQALLLFETIYQRLQDDSKLKLKRSKMLDMLAFKIFNRQNMEPINDRECIGSVPGVEVGDEFNLRVELCVVGLHHQHRNYVDFIHHGNKTLAVSIVHMRAYVEEMGGCGDFVYSSPGDLTLKWNLALKNSLDIQVPVRVILGFKGHPPTNSRATRSKNKVATYIYGGLYLIKRYWRKKDDNGLYECMFRLRRIPGQPDLLVEVSEASRGAKENSGCIMDDTPQVKEKLHIDMNDDERQKASQLCTRQTKLRMLQSNSADDARAKFHVQESQVSSATRRKSEEETQYEYKAVEREENDSLLQMPAQNKIASRQKITEALSLFERIYKKLLDDELKPKSKKSSQPLQTDLLAFKLFNQKSTQPISGKGHIGSIPGVEVGDQFNLRVELCVVGLHHQHRQCVAYVNQENKTLAVSIVHMSSYLDENDTYEDFVYSSSGDLKLEGNQALKNSLDTQNLIRVIYGFRGYKSSNSRGTKARSRSTTYIYGGLYFVTKYWRKRNDDGIYACMFQLRRIPGQPDLLMKGVKASSASTSYSNHIIEDISMGKEKIPIPVVNIIDGEYPKAFKYITNMIYPSQNCSPPPRGCECIGGCSDSESCSCAMKNGGEIPFNYKGAIVEAKPLIYECGPLCKCPPSCHNRVSQRGIQLHLEVFKTESRGWGVRCRDQIPSGTFICEYTGELIDDQVADKKDNDEYLFDIGNNLYDETLWEGLNTNIPDLQTVGSYEIEGSFAVDASECGNVARFINHSCTPNLYAQNLLYDHDNKSMPRVVLFAAENIPPLQELTYDYNYAIDQVRDSDGNIKKKACFCGTADCTGWLY